MPTKIDPYSLAAVPIKQLFGETSLGMATAFVWQRNEKPYLITNWHVASGRNNETGECLAAHGGEPDRLHAVFHGPAPNYEAFGTLNIPLRDPDNRPTWLHHPNHGRAIDVVAVPLPPNGAAYLPINHLPKVELSIQIGMDVFVLGYPFQAEPPWLPVWKRGSIASEPQLVRLSDKFYLIDTASRPGMSGSAVVLRSYGTHLTESGNSITTEPATRFLGVYSGRLKTSDVEDAQLGRVWPESFITEIIDGATRDPGKW